MELERNISSVDRRHFLENLAKAGVLSILPATVSLAATSHKNINNEGGLIAVGPYLQRLSSNAVTVMWVTKRNCLSWVEYGDGMYLNKKAFGYVDGLVQANNRVNKIRIGQLQPDTVQRYRIVSVEVLSVRGSQFKFGEPEVGTIYEYKTPPVQSDEVKMIVFNDHHEISETIPEMIYRLGYDGNEPNFDFVVFNGDVFNNTESEEQVINQFLKPCVNTFAKNHPFLFVQGNHEVRGAFARHIREYFDWTDGRFFHSFRQGPVHFLVLDSGEDKTDDNWEYGGLAAFDQYREKQREWLEKEIQQEAFKTAPFRVLLIHISPWHSGNWHGTMHCRQVFGPLLNKAKIDIQISGHTHQYGLFKPDSEHNFPIMIGGGPKKGNRTLIKLKANKKTLQVDMMRDDGENVGSLTIKAR